MRRCTPGLSARPARVAAAVALSLAAQPIAARAEPPQDPNAIFTIQIENDAVSTLKGTSDQYYTSGERLGFTTGTDDYGVAKPIQALGHFIWGEGVHVFILWLYK